MPVRLLTPADVSAFVEAMNGVDRVAVDTEFHAERRYVPKLFLVQVQVPGGDAWIIDPTVDGLLEACAEALRSTSWVVHGGSHDLLLLDLALGGLPDTVFDTQIGAALVSERYPEGYGSLVSRYLGIVLPKSATLSDWSRRPLTPVQVKYAADDVTRLLQLWDAIASAARDAGRLDLVSSACDDFKRISVQRSDPREAWRRFAAAEVMPARARLVLQELTTWREQYAQDANLPPRAVLGDGSVVDLSKRPPASAAAILENRRFPRGAAKHVDAIWAAIVRGQAAPAANAAPCAERYSRPWRAIRALHAWAVQEGHDRSWSPALVLPDHRLEELVLSPPQDRVALAASLGSWRDALVGDALWSVLSGQATFTMQAGTMARVR